MVDYAIQVRPYNDTRKVIHTINEVPAAMTRNPDSLLYSLQIGRALAALAVVAHHSALAVHSMSPEMSATLFMLLNLGHLGVDYFFVLSGFIIAHATHGMQATATDARAYALSRARRIYIPYLPISVAMVVAFTCIPALSMGAREGFSLISSLTLLPTNVPPALSVAWTLQHELVFYGLFGLCFFGFNHPRLIYGWAAVIGIGLWINLPPWSKVIFSPINLEFLLGVVACNCYHRGRFFAHRYRLAALGLLLVATTGLLLFHGKAPTYYRLLAGLGFVCVVLGLAHMERHAQFARFSRLVFLGSASYAIYLIHGPAISLLMRILPNDTYWLLLLAIMTLLSTLAGVIYFLRIEKPLMRYFRARA